MVGQRDYFELDEIVEELRDQGLRFPKTIIYVPTMDTGSSIYNYFYRKLRRSMIIDVTKLVMFYYAMAGEGTLAFIQEEFTGLDSGIRVLIATRRAKLGQIQGGLQRAIQDSTKGGLQ